MAFCKKSKNENCINTSAFLLQPFDVIQAAARGHEEALNRAIRHYDGYIARLSMRPLYDESGNPRWGVDEAIRRQLENKLVDAIVRRFRVA